MQQLPCRRARCSWNVNTSFSFRFHPAQSYQRWNRINASFLCCERSSNRMTSRYLRQYVSSSIPQRSGPSQHQNFTNHPLSQYHNAWPARLQYIQIVTSSKQLRSAVKIFSVTEGTLVYSTGCLSAGAELLSVELNWGTAESERSCLCFSGFRFKEKWIIPP